MLLIQIIKHGVDVRVVRIWRYSTNAIFNRRPLSFKLKTTLNLPSTTSNAYTNSAGRVMLMVKSLLAGRTKRLGGKARSLGGIDISLTVVENGG